MSEHFDVVIAGGAVIGSSVAWHLATHPSFSGSVLVVEPDPTYQFSASALSAGSIRQQFSQKVNIAISLYGIGFLRDIGNRLEVEGDKPSIGLHEGGYLYLASAAGEAVLRATAADPKDLPKAQALVVTWLSRRYHVAPEPVSRIVQEAWTVGQKTGVEPTLILSVMAIESSFNPFAQSAVGAQGLMQVMTRVHDDKYEAFGGQHAAFDPVTNLKVGAQVLRDCISRAGGIESGLRLYVGAGVGGDDGGYAAKVLAEHLLLKQVLAGRNVAPNTPSTPAPVATTAMAAPAAPSASQQTTQPT